MRTYKYERKASDQVAIIKKLVYKKKIIPSSTNISHFTQTNPKQLVIAVRRREPPASTSDTIKLLRITPQTSVKLHVKVSVSFHLVSLLVFGYGFVFGSRFGFFSTWFQCKYVWCVYVTLCVSGWTSSLSYGVCLFVYSH